ncbi:hypothetical protein EIP91_001262 [Steccherinum ochraceum]|uniref:AMP-dependent synthetase/ligase domain-containing protein n=1 Tax=Steccherinum ochraceum TaxID=92696 RepID=A0A4R0REI2_9APHY|nr:hypothetical protein EIP91_001262 [Steccherinum ochraceum]
MTIYKSHLPSIQVPEESLYSHLFGTRFLDFPPSRPAYIDANTGRTISRGDVRELTLSFGHGLKHAFRSRGGVQLSRGDVVLILSPNSIAWPIMLFGAMSAGLRVTLANSSYVARELEHQWTDSRAKAVIVAPPLVPVVLEMFKNVGLSETAAKQRIILADWGFPRNVFPSEYTTMASLLGLGKLVQEEAFRGKQTEETVLLCYSSGTTGKPKGVETTHRNMVHLINMVQTVFHVVDGDVMLGILPFYHIYGESSSLALFTRALISRRVLQ